MDADAQTSLTAPPTAPPPEAGTAGSPATASSAPATRRMSTSAAEQRRPPLVLFLTAAFGAVIAVTVPFAAGWLSTDLLPAVIPLAQWIPAVCVLAVAGKGAFGGVSSAVPVRPALWRQFGPLGFTLLVFTAVLAAHLGVAVVTGLVGWSGSFATAMLVVPVAAGLLLTTIGEEIGWRGYLLSGLRRWGNWGSSLAAALVWAAWHLPLLAVYVQRGEMSVATATASTFNLVAGGVLLGMLRWRHGTIWSAAWGHALMNSLLVWGYGALSTPLDAMEPATFWAFHAIGWAALSAAAWVASRGAATARVTATRQRPLRGGTDH